MKINPAESRVKNAATHPGAAGRMLPSVFCRHTSRSGIALIITLIMLSVTLVMAIAFIAASRRQRAAVSTSTDTDTARRAVETALAAAQAQIVANIFATSNAGAFNFGLLVSTNYINRDGFDPNPGTTFGSVNTTNVNFDYQLGGGVAFTADQRNRNIANLYFMPRVPVLINNGGVWDFRFYLDFNRNGRYETNGWGPEYSGLTTTPFYDTKGELTNDASVTYNYFSTNIAGSTHVGDPEWVGILERPDQPHGPENHFLARYAFLGQPIGNSLDLNAVHNQTLNMSSPMGNNDGFLRNQSVGSWEINLAAFLADLNTNMWGRFVGYDTELSGQANGYYHYLQPQNYNAGVAFDDARSMIYYRYNGRGNTQATARRYFNQWLANYPYHIDLYTDGALQTTLNSNLSVVTFNGGPDNTTLSWVGADNTNRYYSLPSELFDTAKTSAGFVNRLRGAGTGLFGGLTNSTYDRYTYYRMLEQLGTDSSPDDTRMNLNYNNLAFASTGTANVTNMLAWRPITFFTNAADRLLKYHTARWRAENYGFYTNTFGATTTNAFGLNNIPVFVDGQFVYTPAVNRLLQLAANLYDATVEDVFPSVFRPIFSRIGTNVFITGYTNIGVVSGSSDTVFSQPFDLERFSQVGGVNVPVNIYGVPWILGAKKYLPNFNRLYSLNDVAVTRKLQVTRTSTTPGPTATNEMFVMSITNHIGWAFWNSYNTNYPYGPLQAVVNDRVSMMLTNPARAWIKATNFTANFIVNDWPGSAWTYGTDKNLDWAAKNPDPNSFMQANWTFDFLPEAIYRFGTLGPPDFVPTVDNPTWETGITPVPVFPDFHLLTTNQFQAYLIDTTTRRIVDYVHFDGPSNHRNIYAELANTNSPLGMMWDTNPAPDSVGLTPNIGVVNQITVSQSGKDGSVPPIPSNVNIPSQFWQEPPNIPADLKTPLHDGEAAWFNSFYLGEPVIFQGRNYGVNLNLAQQAPFTPTRVLSDFTMWQANDPLVHYLASDLTDLFGNHVFEMSDDQTINPLPNPALVLYALDNPDAKSKPRYQPWGRQAEPPSANYFKGLFNMSFRDPLMWTSDFWDFPTNRLPSLGWIGRVHRGTPWQTVFLKSTNILQATAAYGSDYPNIGTNTWQYWTGADGNRFDVAHTAPIEDRLLFDLFTAAPNQNAERGALSINQSQLASWSALFSGMVAMTNITSMTLNNEYPSSRTTPVLTNTVVLPAGMGGTNSPIRQIHDSILATRADTNMFPLGVFTHYGDILRVPALSEKSPFINLSHSTFYQYDVNDELYEWLPQQMMGLVTLGAPRYVLYCYGQSLKPAPNGTVLSGTFSQLVTNYQVTAESAARVVLRLDNPLNTNGAPQRVVIESYTPLEPQ